MTENIRFYYYCIQWFTEQIEKRVLESIRKRLVQKPNCERQQNFPVLTNNVEGAFRTQDICKFYNNSVCGLGLEHDELHKWIRSSVCLRVVPGRSHVRVSYPQTIIRVHNSEEFNLRLRVELYESLQSTLFQTFKYGYASPINPTTAMNE